MTFPKVSNFATVFPYCSAIKESELIKLFSPSVDSYSASSCVAAMHFPSSTKMVRNDEKEMNENILGGNNNTNFSGLNKP